MAIIENEVHERIVIPKGTAIPTEAQAHVAYFFPLHIITCWKYHIGKDRVTKRANRPDHQVIFTHAGRAKITVGGDTQYLNPGSIVMIDCMKLHEYEADSDDGWLYSYMHIDGEAMPTYHAFLTDKLRVLYPEDPTEIAHLFAELIPISWLRDPVSSARITTIIFSILEIMVKTRYTENTSDSDHFQEALYPAIRYIQKYFFQNITIDDLANQCCMSQSSFAHAFKLNMGISPYQYIMRLRIKFAQHLLLDTNESIAEISMHTGFSSPSNFIYYFKKNTGYTPFNWRKSNMLTVSEDKVLLSPDS